MKHLFVLNPAAGGGKRTEAVAGQIAASMSARNLDWELYRTTGPMDACRKVRQAGASGAPLRVYACGGDGTLNECVNGAVGQDNVALTHYPTGTGNDFVKLFSKGQEAFFQLDALVDGKPMALDVIDCNGRYGINICSVGIDARIAADVHNYSALPLVGGKTGYLVSLVANLIAGIPTQMEVEAGGKVYRQPFSLVCACNGRYYGGMFNPVPDAMPNDGLMDILLVDKVSRLQFLKLVGKYAKGRYRELADLVTHVQDTRLVIRCEEKIVINIDGESIRDNQVSLSLVPGGVNFIVPQGADFTG